MSQRESPDNETHLAQLLLFIATVVMKFWRVAAQVLNIGVFFWLLKESRKLLWNKIFIIGYIMEFISCLSIQHYASLAVGLSYDGV